jgi:aspartate-semialdehyde dehydrogenase
MASVVGRLRPCPILGVKFTLLGHNTIRGAAGASVLNAELLKVEGLLPEYDRVRGRLISGAVVSA